MNKIYTHIFITAFGDYYLMTPTEAYRSFMEPIKVKCHMSKVVIEFLQNNQDASYEDLLNKLQVRFKSHSPVSLKCLTLSELQFQINFEFSDI